MLSNFGAIAFANLVAAHRQKFLQLCVMETEKRECNFEEVIVLFFDHSVIPQILLSVQHLEQRSQMITQLFHVDLAEGAVFVQRVNEVYEIVRLLFGQLDLKRVVLRVQRIGLKLPFQYLHAASVVLLYGNDENEEGAHAEAHLYQEERHDFAHHGLILAAGHLEVEVFVFVLLLFDAGARRVE